MAIAALVVSIISLFICLLGVYLGRRAHEEIAATGESGDGLARAGEIIGWIAVALGVLQVLAFIGVIAILGSPTIIGGVLAAG